ncbi:MAG: hypothetical protein AAF623_03905 [Planctomycetota bacterium]
MMHRLNRRIQSVDRSITHRIRLGYTLLELLLSLGLTVIIMAAIAGAIQLYMVALTKQQAMIERKQVARNVLMMIGKDVRAAIMYKPGDYSGLENLYQTAALMLQQDPSLAQQAEDQGVSESPGEDSGVIDEDATSFRPTLYGTNSALIMDISKLPRLDEYNPLMATDLDEVSSPSDVKSVAYFVALSNGGMEEEIQFTQSRAPGGLYRRTIDRAVAEFMGETDILSSPDDYTQLIAHEIAQINFRYFDGESWLTSWDSEENGGFPTTIEITIVVDPERSSPTSQEYSFSGFDQTTMESFTYAVNLPIAEPTAEQEDQ